MGYHLGWQGLHSYPVCPLTPRICWRLRSPCPCSQRGSLDIILPFLVIWLMAFKGCAARQGVGDTGGIQAPTTRCTRSTFVSSAGAAETNSPGMDADFHRLPIALFWLGWSSKASIHPVVPMMSGLLFGIGYILIFMAMINYLTDAYEQYSASAQAAASTLRSCFAVCLPLATNSMYGNLRINWASSVLAFVAIVLAVIPFVFIRYGQWIRSHSPFSHRVMKGQLAGDSPAEGEPVL